VEALSFLISTVILQHSIFFNMKYAGNLIYSHIYNSSQNVVRKRFEFRFDMVQVVLEVLNIFNSSWQILRTFRLFDLNLCTEDNKEYNCFTIFFSFRTSYKITHVLGILQIF
jgi:hypothetical protein